MNGQNVRRYNASGKHLVFKYADMVDMIGIQKEADQVRYVQSINYADGTHRHVWALLPNSAQ